MSFKHSTPNWSQGLCSAKQCCRISLSLSCLCSPVQHLCYIRALLASEIFFCSPPRLIIPISFPSPPILPLSSPKCILFTSDRVSHLPQINDLHSFSPPAAQEMARQVINATQTLPGLETRYTISLDYVGRHAKSHQLQLSYAAACKSGLKRGQREAGCRMSMGNPAARAVALPQDPTLLQQLRNPFLPHRQTRLSCNAPQCSFALGAPG